MINTNPSNLNKQSKDSSFLTQLQTIFLYLSKYVATATMVSKATNIPQKNICRFKKDLEKQGLLMEVEKKPCKVTGFKAWYLTTNPELFNKKVTNQLNIF
jgi:predicted transcriptional regulator